MTFGPMTGLLYVTCETYVTFMTHVPYMVTVTLRSFLTGDPFLSFVALLILGHGRDLYVTCINYQ